MLVSLSKRLINKYDQYCLGYLPFATTSGLLEYTGFLSLQFCVPGGSGVVHGNGDQTAAPFWDEDEVMEDLEGQDLDEMTKQLVSFRQPGSTLHQHVSLHIQLCPC